MNSYNAFFVAIIMISIGVFIAVEYIIYEVKKGKRPLQTRKEIKKHAAYMRELGADAEDIRKHLSQLHTLEDLKKANKRFEKLFKKYEK